MKSGTTRASASTTKIPTTTKRIHCGRVSRICGGVPGSEITLDAYPRKASISSSAA
jgi:hypothetical protein